MTSGLSFWATAVIVAVLTWAVVGITYLAGLRRLLEVRENLLGGELDELAERLGGWRAMLGEVARREWRESGEILGRRIEELTSNRQLAVRVEVLQELRMLFDRQWELISQEPETFPATVRERASDVQRSLARSEEALTRYSAAAADAAFACERIPLSLVALVVNLRARPVPYEAKADSRQVAE